LRQSFRQVLRDETKTNRDGRLTMQPCRHRGRVEGIKALGKKARDKARENVTASARRELRWSIRIYYRASIRGGYDRIGAFDLLYVCIPYVFHRTGVRLQR
jgi:hypothetical protein